MKKIITNILFIIGIIICSAPIFLNMADRNEQKDLINSYKTQTESMDKNDINKEIEEAKKYNEELYKLKSGMTPEETIEYEETLSSNDYMCTLSIPKINVELPVYHDTSDKVLAKALGHLEGTSLPVGGKETHSFITGHRGLPSSKLFVRLDELEKEDMFYVQLYDNVLAYKVVNIQVVEPDNTEIMTIEKGKDLVSLVTCTPYGINSHRLVVTGERTEYNVEKKTVATKIKPSFRELLSCLPLVICALFITDTLIERRKNK